MKRSAIAFARGAWIGVRMMVNPCQRRARAVSTQHGDLVTEHEDLGVLGCVGPREQCQPAQYTGEHQVGESEGHSGRSCWAGCGS
jgi:hypothetical protein